MSFIASMVAASAASAGLVTAGGIGAAALGAAATGAAGAGIGAGVSALTGGDVGEGALMGGIGGLGAGAGAALSGATMGASAIGAEGAAATPFAAAAPVASTTAATAAPTAATAAPTATTQTASEGINQMLAQGSTQTASQSPTQTASQGISSMLGESTTPAQMSAINPAANSTNIVGSQEAAKQAAQQFAAQDAGWGSQLLNKAGLTELGTTGSKIGGQALENAVYGAGINGLLAGAQGQDVGKAMGIGALSGGIGGAAGAGLAEAPGAVGEFAAAHPMITSGAIGMGANTALNGLTASNPSAPDYKGIRSNVKWNPNVYKPYGPQFAAGGITDLDNYDAAPNQPITAPPGTLDIPNRNEVANNQGYMGDSVQLMAHGGISDLGGYSDGGRLLKGPGDGVSDDIPASIGGKQPARLAEGEFVIPARIVSELGNGSTDAGAKRLYQMMDRIQSDRRKTTGKGKFSDNPKAYKHLPA